MKKRLFVFTKEFSSYILDKDFWNNNIVLGALVDALRVVTIYSDPKGKYPTSYKNFPQTDDLYYSGVEIWYEEELDQVEIIPLWMIKKEDNNIEIEDDEEAMRNSSLYLEYYLKRYAEIPKLKLSAQNWELLEKEWLELMDLRPKYLIVELDDSGPLSIVKLIGKQELSSQDIQDLLQEHEHYLKYKKAYEKYKNDHPNYSHDLWRTPQDDEYEADIMKYYQD